MSQISSQNKDDDLPKHGGTLWAKNLLVNYKKKVKHYEQEKQETQNELANAKARMTSLQDPDYIKREVFADLMPSCEICLEPYDHMNHWQSCITICGHMFGRSCIVRNFEESNRCPKCNRIYTKENIITLF